MNERKILVVDDEPHAREALVALLEDEGYSVRDAPDGFKALGVLRNWDCDVILTDLRMPVMDGLTLIRKAKAEKPEVVTVVMTAFGTVENAVDAMKAGCDDYLTKPLNFDQVQLVMERVFNRLDMKRELSTLRERSSFKKTTRIIGCSEPIAEVTKLAEQVAKSRANVLVTGESGTGKELVAQLVHEASDRADGPFMSVHCAALAESLLESELFGHEKGAFTGASGRRIGKFEEANGGTLFLDEIGEISPSIQVKLLRFLQEKEFERVGGNKTINVDVRIVTATNRDLRKEVREGRFREDLYFRLNVINITTPPLRARRSDIPLLVRHFITRYASENGKAIGDISPEAMRRLERHDWPGNVRELQNTVERAVILATGTQIEVHNLPSEFEGPLSQLDDTICVPGSTLADIEKYAILKTYETTGGHTGRTADILGISVRKIQYKLKEYREKEATV